MKNHDLFNALSDTDEKLVNRAAASMSRHPNSFTTFRFLRIGAMAASLALILAVGAISLPFLLKNDPATSPLTDTIYGSVEQTTPDDFVKAPTSIMYLISQDAHTSDDSIVNSETQDSFWGDNLALMTFDCLEGETVDITTFWDSLFTRSYPNDGHETWEGLDPASPEDRKTYIDILRGFGFGGLHAGKRNVTLDVNTAFLIWKYDTDNLSKPLRGNLNYYLKKLESAKAKFGEDSWQYLKALEEYEELYDAHWGDDYSGLQLAANEDILSYVTRNADGEITGAGAVYVYRKHLIENEENSYFADTYISRYADLGFVRFDAPVTEEAAEIQLKELYEAIPEAKAGMNFAPVSEEENYKAGLADLLNTMAFEAPEDHYTTSGFGGGSADDYRTFHIGFVPKDSDVIDAGHADYVFRIYSDGTWKEMTE